MLKEFPETNEWNDITFHTPEGYDYLVVDFKLNHYALNIEYLGPDGKIYRPKSMEQYRTGLTEDMQFVVSPGFIDWRTDEWVGRVSFPVSEVKWRYNDKEFNTVQRVLEVAEVGDFIKFKGTRSNIWNRIDTINYTCLTIFGQKYSKPNEDYARYISSENGIVKTKTIIAPDGTVKFAGVS